MYAYAKKNKMYAIRFKCPPRLLTRVDCDLLAYACDFKKTLEKSSGVK